MEQNTLGFSKSFCNGTGRARGDSGSKFDIRWMNWEEVRLGSKIAVHLHCLLIVVTNYIPTKLSVNLN